jgi:hypothetical protein
MQYFQVPSETIKFLTNDEVNFSYVTKRPTTVTIQEVLPTVSPEITKVELFLIAIDKLPNKHWLHDFIEVEVSRPSLLS